MSALISSSQPTQGRQKVLWFLYALAVITYLDRVCISAAAPAITAEFGFTKAQMGYIFSAFTVAYAVFEIPSGWLGDRFGTRLALTRIVTWWSAFTALTGAVWGFWSLFVVRFLFGAGEAGAFPNIARSVADWLPAKEQGRGMSMSFRGLATGAALSAPLVLTLQKWQGWRWTFLEFGLLGAVWALAWHRWFRDQPEEHPEVNAAEVALIRSDVTKPKVSHHVPWRTLFTSRNLATICAMYFAYAYSLYFYLTWLPTYLIEARGFPSDKAKWYAALPWVLSIGTFWFGGWLTDRLARTHGLKIARCGVGACGYSLSGLVLVAVPQVQNRVWAAVLLALALCFQSATISAAWAVCLDVGRRNAGVVTGFMNSFGNIGGALAPLVVGHVVERYHSWAPPFYVMALVFAFGAVMWLLVDPNKSVLDSEDERAASVA
jgi:ACS family glucarate transporter-like MFS transporter